MCRAPANDSEVNDLLGLANGVLGTMAMVNYPYMTSFTVPGLSAWPVHAACDAALSSPIVSDADKIAALMRASAVYYNSSG